MSQKSCIQVLALLMILCIIVFSLSFPSWKTELIIFFLPTQAVRRIIALLWIPQMKGTTEEQTVIIVANLCPRPVTLTLLNSAYSVEEILSLWWRKSWVKMTLFCNKNTYPLAFNTLLFASGMTGVTHIISVTQCTLMQYAVWTLLFLYPKQDCSWINSLFVVANDIHSRGSSSW